MNSNSNTNINSNATQSNNSIPVVLTPTSVPPSFNISSPLSSHSTTSAENRSILPHPTSALSAQYHPTVSKSSHSPASLKLRRELSQPAMNRIELFSSTDCPMEKLIANDIVPMPYRTSLKINGSQPPFEIRSRLPKTNSTRLSVDYLPTRQTNRSKVVTDRLPSPKGKSLKIAFFFSFGSSVS